MEYPNGTMMAPILDIGLIVEKNAGVSTHSIQKVLRMLKFQEMNDVCKRGDKDNELSTAVLDDITKYNDDYFSMEKDKTSKMLVFKIGEHKTILTCFEPRMDRIQVRTLQQKLADVTTNYVIRKLSDDDYELMFKAFYKPMTLVLDAYCKLRKLSTSTDVVLYYKGGNVFRILLTHIIHVLENVEYQKLMTNRSDADFQIYINPDLKKLEKIRSEVQLLVVYVLYNLKYFFKEKKITLVDDSNLDVLKDEYSAELKNAKIEIKDLEVLTRVLSKREDFMVASGKVFPEHDKELVMVRKFPCIVNGMRGATSAFFISRNTSLDFKRKDNLRATFDLIRMRRNFRLVITHADGQENKVNAPFEIIDVSLPKGDDYGLKKLTKGNIDKLVREYKYGDAKFTFKAPTVYYQLQDLHDVLFRQNEYPWNDIKYSKRITRYFLTVIVYEIVEKLGQQKDIKEFLEDIKQAFNYFIKYLGCFIDGSKCDSHSSFLNTSYTKYLYEEFQMIQQKVGNLQGKDLEKESINLIKFSKDIKGVFTQLVKDLTKLKASLNKAKEKDIIDVFDKLFVRGQTNVL